jgi:hypothetical protein
MKVGSEYEKWFVAFTIWRKTLSENAVILDNELFFRQLADLLPSRLHHDNDNAYMT